MCGGESRGGRSPGGLQAGPVVCLKVEVPALTRQLKNGPTVRGPGRLTMVTVLRRRVAVQQIALHERRDRTYRKSRSWVLKPRLEMKRGAPERGRCGAPCLGKTRKGKGSSRALKWNRGVPSRRRGLWQTPSLQKWCWLAGCKAFGVAFEAYVIVVRVWGRRYFSFGGRIGLKQRGERSVFMAYVCRKGRHTGLIRNLSYQTETRDVSV